MCLSTPRPPLAIGVFHKTWRFRKVVVWCRRVRCAVSRVCGPGRCVVFLPFYCFGLGAGWAVLKLRRWARGLGGLQSCYYYYCYSYRNVLFFVPCLDSRGLTLTAMDGGEKVCGLFSCSDGWAFTT
ncbi:hypothetical protein GMDG_00085 [Pseudogymnoascus destructans 20631-21]|uniref:Uncharacterized protein n=1 Tax=Pseudogymnoascus destructans (strain ATCC MYA-4855 / 20631-21) TaxID=658429 RepID=L8FMD8_PSED2|nr:hypothetical protein GMDG_00085 [Pseudogymnoascus destructans 20631-21]